MQVVDKERPPVLGALAYAQALNTVLQVLQRDAREAVTANEDGRYRTRRWLALECAGVKSALLTRALSGLVLLKQIEGRRGYQGRTEYRATVRP